jgi:hypothetical protein
MANTNLVTKTTKPQYGTHSETYDPKQRAREEAMKQRRQQKNLQASQANSMGSGGMSKAKIISKGVGWLPGGGYALDIVIIVAGASVYFLPFALQLMIDEGLSKRNIYRSAGIVAIWIIVILFLIVFAAIIIDLLLQPWKVLID